MRALALIALLIPLTAEAGMLGGGNGLVRARTSPVAARYIPRVGQTFVGERGETVTVTRASAKTCLAGGVWISVAANQPCIGDSGLSVEGSRTQYALANCTAPADQTVTLAAGAHTLWLEGAGTVAAAVGTATATGLPCTATAAAACSFTVTVGGTVTLDVTAPVDRMQVENGVRSSLICATTTPVTRAADVVTASHGIADPNRWSISAVASPSSWSSNTPMWSLLAGSTNSARVLPDAAGGLGVLIYDGSAYRQWGTAPLALSGEHRVTLGYGGPSAVRLLLDGTEVSLTASGTGTGVLASPLTGMAIGNNAAGTTALGGSISAITTCNTAIPEECN